MEQPKPPSRKKFYIGVLLIVVIVIIHPHPFRSSLIRLLNPVPFSPTRCTSCDFRYHLVNIKWVVCVLFKLNWALTLLYTPISFSNGNK